MSDLPGTIQRGARLTVGNVPEGVIKSAVQKLEALNIPVRQSTIFYAGIGRLLGMNDDDLRAFVTEQTTPGRRTSVKEITNG